MKNIENVFHGFCLPKICWNMLYYFVYMLYYVMPHLVFPLLGSRLQKLKTFQISERSDSGDSYPNLQIQVGLILHTKKIFLEDSQVEVRVKSIMFIHCSIMYVAGNMFDITDLPCKSDVYATKTRPLLHQCSTACLFRTIAIFFVWPLKINVLQLLVLNNWIGSVILRVRKIHGQILGGHYIL